jgi:hypothetical protein
MAPDYTSEDGKGVRAREDSEIVGQDIRVLVVDDDGLTLCFGLKQQPVPPGVRVVLGLLLSVSEVRRRALRIIQRLQAEYRVRPPARISDHDPSWTGISGITTLRRDGR